MGIPMDLFLWTFGPARPGTQEGGRTMPSDYFPIFIFLVVNVAVAALIIVLSTYVVKRKPSPQKLMPYECGLDPIGSARKPFPVKFFVIAVLFIIFDIEAVFLYPWAVIYKELLIFGLIEMGVFIGILLLGLFYVWRKGALEWE
jgi:NADH-quinone oxidoreductase subunit A